MSDRTTIATNAFLKGLLTDAVVDRGSIKDANEAIEAGVYIMDGNSSNPTQNVPTLQGVLIVFAHGATKVQIYASINNSCAMYFRLNWYGTGWRDWMKITSAAVTA